MKRLVILPFAEIDLKETLDYYKEKTEGIDIVFLKEINSSFRQILKNPEIAPKYRRDIQKFVLSKFPFCIYYIDTVQVIYIFAIFHNKRNPKEWQRRKMQ